MQYWYDEEPYINQFQGQYFFLSNFFPVELTYLGHLCRTSEHAFQLAKTDDLAARRSIEEADSPAEAKKIGKKAALRSDWTQVRTTIMREIVLLKFAGNVDLASRLVETGRTPLIEGNTWDDTFWGVNLRTGRGENMLGRILMETRSRLRALNHLTGIPL